MSTRQKMVDQFGEAAVRRPATCAELYDAIDIVTEAFRALRKRMDDMESAPIRYRGVWQRSDEYKRGNVVTDDGSAWHAVRDVAPGDRPGKSDSWQLMVKAGRDARP